MQAGAFSAPHSVASPSGFLLKLYQMIETEGADIISWEEGGPEPRQNGLIAGQIFSDLAPLHSNFKNAVCPPATQAA